jgi:acyl-CoA synthetase (NDP forming)
LGTRRKFGRLAQRVVRAFADLRSDEAAAALATALERGGGWLEPAEVELLLSCYGMPTPEALGRIAPPGVEMLVGMVHDPQFGPVVACGMGGTTAELIADVAVRLTPVTNVDASEMVRSLRTYPLLRGYRGAARVNVDALEDIVLRLAAMVDEHAEVAEVDMNPAIVSPRARSSWTRECVSSKPQPRRPWPAVGA